MKELQKMVNDHVREAQRRVKSKKADFRARARRGPDTAATVEQFMASLLEGASNLAYAEGQLDKIEDIERSLRFLKKEGK